MSMTTLPIEAGEPDQELERQLAQMTEWGEPMPDPTLCAEALERTRAGGKPVKRDIWTTKLSHGTWWLVGSSLAAAVLIFALLPSLGTARNQVAYDRSPALARPAPSPGGSTEITTDQTPTRLSNGAVTHPESWPDLSGRRLDQGVIATDGMGFSRQQDREPPGSVNRLVVRKATIELKTDDVRSTFLKASLVVSAAHGEFVEASALTGEDEHARANLTLRVRADRLSTVLTALRELGIVVNEQLGGEDVTAQAVDIEARLRNEQRVETELLELLESRPEAPLEDILQLRDEIGRVRDQIERLTAQQQNLERLVSMATVLVLIHPAEPVEDQAAEDEQPGIGAYFGEAISGAWNRGLRAVADAAAWLVNVLVGGVIWWAIVITCVVAALRLHRRTGLARLSEA